MRSQEQDSSMKITVCGVNYKTAELNIRQQCAFDEATQKNLIADILTESTASQAMVLVTCNRTEIYSDTNNTRQILALLQKHSGLEGDTLDNCYYEYHGQMAVDHLFRVACGMDSMVMGETQILGQIKEAFSKAKSYGAIDTSFNELSQVTFALAKKVRFSTEVGMCPVSIASIASKKVMSLLDDITTANVLVIGSGETSELLVNYLSKLNINSITIAARNQPRATELAKICNGKVITLKKLHENLVDADVIMSATASQVPILGKGAIETALQKRDGRSMILVDMAVPRDIEAEASELNVSLFTIDDLRVTAEENLSVREHSFSQAEGLIVESAAKFMNWLNGKDSSYTLKAYHRKANQIREKELAKAKTMLANGSKAEDVLDYLSRSISNKLLHQPSILLRYSDEIDHPEFKAFIRELFH